MVGCSCEQKRFDRPRRRSLVPFFSDPLLGWIEAMNSQFALKISSPCGWRSSAWDLYWIRLRRFEPELRHCSGKIAIRYLPAKGTPAWPDVRLGVRLRPSRPPSPVNMLALRRIVAGLRNRNTAQSLTSRALRLYYAGQLVSCVFSKGGIMKRDVLSSL